MYSRQELLDKISEAKNILLKDSTYQKMCEEFGVEPESINLIPVRFGDIDVSAKTVRGVIILSYKLLKDDNFKNNLQYLLHEISHHYQMLTRNHPTQSANDGEYLENPDEIEAFTYHIEYMDDNFGKSEVEKYLEHLLNHHEIEDDEEREEKKEELSERIAE